MQSTGNLLLVTLTLFLALAAIEDLARRRISNTLTFGAALLALTLQFASNGLAGLLNGLGGLGVGLAVFLPFFLLRGMGAGDVKTMAAAGAFLAPLPMLLATGLTLFAGAALGLGVLAVRGGLVETLRRCGLGLMCLACTGRLVRGGPPEGTAGAVRLPYALAIAVGTLSAVYWLGFR